MVLIGHDHRQPLHGVNVEGILETEIYEYIQTLYNGMGAANGLPHFQSFKLVYASLLQDLGLSLLAKKYCESVELVITNFTRGSPYFHRRLQDTLRDLQSRLSKDGSDSGGHSSGNDEKEGGSGWLGNGFMTFFDRGLNKIINGAVGIDNDEPASTKPNDPANASVVSGYFSAAAALKPTATLPTSGHANAVDGNNNSQQQHQQGYVYDQGNMSTSYPYQEQPRYGSAYQNYPSSDSYPSQDITNSNFYQSEHFQNQHQNHQPQYAHPTEPQQSVHENGQYTNYTHPSSYYNNYPSGTEVSSSQNNHPNDPLQYSGEALQEASPSQHQESAAPMTSNHLQQQHYSSSVDNNDGLHSFQNHPNNSNMVPSFGVAASQSSAPSQSTSLAQSKLLSQTALFPRPPSNFSGAAESTSAHQSAAVENSHEDEDMGFGNYSLKKRKEGDQISGGGSGAELSAGNGDSTASGHKSNGSSETTDGGGDDGKEGGVLVYWNTIFDHSCFYI